MSTMTETIKKEYATLPPREKWEGWLTYEESTRIVKRDRDTFAVFGTQAYKLSRFETDEILMVPAIRKGKIIARFPEEGRSGVLHLFYIKEKKKWCASFVPCGWIYLSELNLTNKEILNNIADDVIAGENVLTNKPAGWA